MADDVTREVCWAGDRGLSTWYFDDYRKRVAALLAVVEASENVVAQWRGDISRKPMIGQLRDAIAEWKLVSTSATDKDPSRT